ncbi:hypothetical protein QQF64_030838 [Cirrhinus molitorella]|uniref:Uncharacterized protein n=1 Tax=Cirrhinus molitorella TaxID=172907 RepID=A0ABR3N4S2_9TELE
MADPPSLTSSRGALAEELQCSVCLNVFTDPVTIPCGHNFCKRCLNQCWEKSQNCICPLCKETFSKRPDLKINTALRQLVQLFQKKPSVSKSDVLCDICDERKKKALKSCLLCQASFCKTHLEFHQKIYLMKHKLLDPVKNMKDYMCQKHERPLELFCRDDQMCVCVFCTDGDHKTHNTVTLEEESKEKKTQLMKTQKDVQQMILDRIRKIQDIEYFAELRKKSTDQVKAANVELFSDLMCSIERCQAELLEMIEENQEKAQKLDEELNHELQQEITELTMRKTELDHLLHTEDHLHLLQIDPSLCSPPHTRNWPQIRMNTDVSVETLRGALTQLQETLDEKLCQTVLTRMRQHAVDVTLDPDTAHPNLILSDDGKQGKKNEFFSLDILHFMLLYLRPEADIHLQRRKAMAAKNRSRKYRRSKDNPSSMSSSTGLLAEELKCSLCLNVFIDPVSTPCGHNFCRSCLNQCWENIQNCYCPFCKETFSKRPDLKINTALRQVAQLFQKKLSLSKSEVLCDVCDDRKMKALKSCLECQTSYCETHLEPHQRALNLKKHKLVDPVENINDYICQKHERPLELFCRDDQMCLCVFCTDGDHKTHNTVTLQEESNKKKIQMMKTQREMQQMIQDRIKKIQDIKDSAELRKKCTEQDVELFSDLMRSIERCQAELLEMMEMKQKAAEKQDEQLIQELQGEITNIKRRNTELDQLLHTEDHLHLLQTDPSVCSPPHTRNWSEIKMNTDVSVETLRRALTELQETLDEKLSQTVLRRMQQYSVDVTLDPDTAHPNLILSDDGKQVTHGDIKQNLSNNAERTDSHSQLCHPLAYLESQLMKTQKDMQQMIQDRIKKIQDIKRSAELRKSSAEQEKAASVELFSDLMRSIERCQAELLEMMEEKQKAAEKQDEKLIQELQQEITELSMRNTELDHLLHTEDHLHLLQIDPSLCSPPHTRNWSEISMNTDVSVETLRRALTQLQETLDKKLSRTVLRRMEQYAVDLTLNPDTAHPYLILSNDGKQTRHKLFKKQNKQKKKKPDIYEIFKDCEHSLYSLTALKVKSNGRFFINVNKTDLETDYGYASIFILH